MALSTVVAVRSYSRILGETSCEAGDAQLRQRRSQRIADRALMLRVDMRIDQANRHCRRTRLPAPPR